MMAQPINDDVDDFLYKSMPREIKALNKEARKARRLKKRAVWAAQNPNRIPQR